jgi:ABC-type multidrug transport system fused ATPase/permease subunit
MNDYDDLQHIARERRLDEADERERNAMRRYRIGLIGLFATMGVIAFIWTFVGSRLRLFDPNQQSLNDVRTELLETRSEVKRASDSISAMQLTLSGLQGNLKATATLNPADLQRLNTVVGQQITMGDRLKTLESAISTDPVKALSVPLVRKDVEALQTIVSNNAVIFNNEMTRVNYLVIAFFGLMGTFLGLIFTGGKDFRRTKDKLDEPKPEGTAAK